MPRRRELGHDLLGEKGQRGVPSARASHADGMSARAGVNVR